MLPGKLAAAVAFLEQHPHVGLVFTNFTTCDENGVQFPGTFLDNYEWFRKQPKIKTGEAQFIIERNVAYEGLIHENYMGTSGVVLPKAVLGRIGEFDESLSGPEDLDMWLRVTRHYDVGYLSRIGHQYRKRRSGITGRGTKFLAPQAIRVMRKQLELDLSASAYKRARWIISRVFFEIGYHHQLSGNVKEARRNYWQSLRETYYWPSVKGLVLCLFGRTGVAVLMSLKNKVCRLSEMNFV
jgi:hypothetical protein